jgi:hypothetical protein
MSFLAFGQSIVRPDLRSIAVHWHDARGTRCNVDAAEEDDFLGAARRQGRHLRLRQQPQRYKFDTSDTGTDYSAIR